MLSSFRRPPPQRRCSPTCVVTLRESCCEEMGASVTRAIRNFNLENRAEREISKMKPAPAPRHPSTKSLLREQMNCKWCEGARAPGAGWAVPRWWTLVQWPGCPESASVARVRRWSLEAGDIEPAPLCPLWSRRLQEMTTCDRADPALFAFLSLTLTHLIQGIKIRRNHVQVKFSRGVFTERWTPSLT